jgi:SSS family solute:Na+ symporter
MMRLLPPGLLGLVFAALVAAIIASTASKINSIATIFTLDLYAKFRGERTKAEDDKSESTSEEKHLVLVGRITAMIAIIIAIILARPLIGSSEQAFQFIQEFSGFFTPGITVIFLLGLFWKRATEAGAIVAAVTSVALSTIMKYALPSASFSQGMNDYLTPFINRMGVVFLVSLLLAVIVSLATRQRPDVDSIDTANVRYKTSAGFNIGALGVILILIALYATWW